MNLTSFDEICAPAKAILWNSKIGNVDILWTRLTKVDAERLDRFPCRVLCCPCTGLDHIDLAECHRRNIKVLSLRDTDVLPTITATAEHTIGLILALVRKIPSAVESVKRGEWDRYRFMGRELSGMNLGILGFGRIGQMVYSIAMAFGMQCRSVTADCIKDVAWSVTKSSDIVTMHVDLNDSTRGMCNAEFFGAMKSQSYFINTARGAIVDESALLAALRSGHLAGAALDVVEGENGERRWVHYPPTRQVEDCECGGMRGGSGPRTSIVCPACDGTACERTGISQELIGYARENPDRLIITPHIGGCAVEAIEKAEVALAKRLIQELEKC